MSLVSLTPVAPHEVATLANLLELYCHDMSPYFALTIGTDGRFGYPHLASYFREPERRFPFFIVNEGQLAGFALATRGSPASSDPSHLDLAEFFVLRACRRRGLGAQAAFALWDRLIGHWIVRAAENNRPAVAFWARTVDAYANGGHQHYAVRLAGVERRVFEFDSRGCTHERA